MTDIDTTHSYSARESWLQQAVTLLRPRFIEAGFPVPDKLRVAVGFGPAGARQENQIILGVTLHTSCSADGVNEIWISPEDADTASMIATLIHELVHAALNNEDGHRGRFAECAVRLGLEGKMTATVPSLGLAAELMVMAAELGPYPGAKVDLTAALVPSGTPRSGGGRTSSGPSVQTNRQLLLTCSENDCACGGYKVRTSAKWIATGLPMCPMGFPMTPTA